MIGNTKTPIKLVCFDLDDTLLLQNSWVKLNIGLGVTEKEDQYYYEQYHKGAITYAEWQQTLLELYTRNGPVSRVSIDAILQAYELHPDAGNVIARLQERDYQLALASGSFSILVTAVAERLGIEDSFGATSFVFDGDDHLQTITNYGDEATAKLQYLERLAERSGVALTECACIADGPMMR